MCFYSWVCEVRAPPERGIMCELCGSGLRGTNDRKQIKRESGDVERQGKWQAKWKVSPQKLWRRGEKTTREKSCVTLLISVRLKAAPLAPLASDTWCFYQPNCPDTLPPLPLCRVGGFLKRLFNVFKSNTLGGNGGALFLCFPPVHQYLEWGRWEPSL